MKNGGDAGNRTQVQLGELRFVLGFSQREFNPSPSCRNRSSPNLLSAVFRDQGASVGNIELQQEGNLNNSGPHPLIAEMLARVFDYSICDFMWGCPLGECFAENF